MQIDRYMVNLFFEIKRNLPHAEQSEIKIADHGLGDLMLGLHAKTEDENIKVLIEAFLEHAGPEWLQRLNIKPWRYRGVKVSGERSVSSTASKSADATKEKPVKKAKSKKKVRYYRGVRIEDD